MGKVIGLLKETFSEFTEDKALRLSAAMAYYTIFSIAPLLIIIIAIISLVLGEEAASGQIVGQISGLVGQDSAETIQGAISSGRQASSGIVATVFGVVMLLLGASGLFGQLHDALNTIWDVAPKPGQGIMAIIKQRFLSLTMVFGVAFLLLVSLVLSAALSLVTGAFGTVLPLPPLVIGIIDNVVSIAVITVLFAMIFKVLPDVQISFRDVWIGAFATAVLFTIGKFAIGLYLETSGTASTYGAAGSLIVLLLWIYYSSAILFLGAEFTQVYARRFGSKIVPSDHAIPLTEEAKATQGMVSTERKQAIAATGALPGQRVPAVVAYTQEAVGQQNVSLVGRIVTMTIFAGAMIVAGMMGKKKPVAGA